MPTGRLHWRVVLVRPRNPLNIGAAARAMANFGFRQLVVVEPYEPVWQETRSAVGAEEVVQSARRVDQVREAVGDCTLVIGATAGSGRNLDRELIALNRLPAWIESRLGRVAPVGDASESEGGKARVESPVAPQHAAVLFGSEKTGLSTEVLSYCHALVRIPTSAECPSMNLGQAVAVCCYELTRAKVVSAVPISATVHVSAPANVQSLDHLFDRAVRILDHVGYLKPKSRDATLIKLRRVLFDLELTNNDVKILGGILAQIEWKFANPSKAVANGEWLVARKKDGKEG
ncbi:MAG TPA: TrmH family RNA methyltransferase [Terriglobia bacterium]|nr:TrmH family RNA methyltransferase [Terriglobia bacterium]